MRHPDAIREITLRPDIVIHSPSTQQFIMVELTVPYENRMEQAHAPTTDHDEEEIEQFYDDSSEIIKRNKACEDKLLVVGDFNAKVGKDPEQRWNNIKTTIKETAKETVGKKKHEAKKHCMTTEILDIMEEKRKKKDLKTHEQYCTEKRSTIYKESTGKQRRIIMMENTVKYKSWTFVTATKIIFKNLRIEKAERKS
ncbi:reverse transcriptase [Elysia marginata]|uniref:Reverse transcriptase n=1 Tax=Elysia marginata TaxID=1093978 RepID=A0AAV4F971_9GAST|nr:reverse transcriptase [Elysia marginata]